MSKTIIDATFAESITEKDAIAAIRARMEAVRAIKPLETAKEGTEAIVRAWMDANRRTALSDDETGMEARLVEQTRGGNLDLEAISDEGVLILARAGYLQAVPEATAKALHKSHPLASEYWAKYKMPGKPVTMLRFDKE